MTLWRTAAGRWTFTPGGIKDTEAIETIYHRRVAYDTVPLLEEHRKPDGGQKHSATKLEQPAPASEPARSAQAAGAAAAFCINVN